MNKFVMVLGVAAVATLSGCKDPNYKPMGLRSQDEVKSVPTETPEPAEVHCTCPAGTKHTEPCTCGASDCKCVVEKVVEVKTVEPEKPVETVVTPPAEPEFTMYIVQRGDYLAKISKKYNVKIDAIKQLNNLKSDKIRLGQKLKLPGKIDVGEQTVPEGAIAKPKPVTKKYTPYTGATVEYTVKGGDTLGAIAYGNGINIRQLKELNGLTKDDLKIGQKLKIPAEGKAAASVKETEKVAPVKADPIVNADPINDQTAPVVDEVKPLPVEEPAPTVEPVPPVAELPDVSPEELTYIVQEGEDLMAISIATGVSLSTIRELNNLPEDAKLTTGQVLKLPVEE